MTDSTSEENRLQRFFTEVPDLLPEHPRRPRTRSEQVRGVEGLEKQESNMEEVCPLFSAAWLDGLVEGHAQDASDRE